MAGMMITAVCALILLRGVWLRAPVYEAFLEGAEEGFRTAVSLLPALCAMLLMLGILRSSGLLALLTRLLSPLLGVLGLPVETGPVLLLRPLTGSGSLAALEQVFVTCGVDSRAGRVASVLVGSSETIFYTMTVYLAETRINKLPGALGVSLISYLVSAAVAGALA